MNVVVQIAHRCASLALLILVIAIAMMFTGRDFFGTLPVAFILADLSFVLGFLAWRFLPIDRSEAIGVGIFSFILMLFLMMLMVPARLNHLAPFVQNLYKQLAGS